ncbi:MAG: hypothetical protein Q4G50_13975 [Corynebacterium sp.]|uniref:hypothetical protein n=1 Tax=Corynebacterium sp. TaxID=1720 RepID=UPI0026E0CC48|nr:hypothetical protein [Corynebacterium sp.]MDO5671093.1 hypothetical protein [Corynebacterium sp.]
MEDAHLLYPCQRYDTRGRGWLRTNGKYYVVDQAIRNSLLGSRTSDAGHVLENQVFFELLRRGYSLSTGLTAGGEIDFRAVKNRREIFLQVALSALNPATLERELSSFRGLPPGSPCYLLTLDRIDLGTGPVLQVNAADFLAGGELE